MLRSRRLIGFERDYERMQKEANWPKLHNFP